MFFSTKERDVFEPRWEPARSLYKALKQEMTNRDKCKGLEWIDNERNAIFNTAMKISEGSNYRTPTLEDVVRAEISARGHTDYTAKFAYGVANFMTGVHN